MKRKLISFSLLAALALSALTACGETGATGTGTGTDHGTGAGASPAATTAAP
jgi:hypothetical protein